MKAPNFKLEMKGERTARLEIYDEIGPSWAGMIDASTVSKAINEAGPLDSIEVRVNSPGGSIFQGVAIYNILKSHPATVNMKVDGVAASSASVVLMAGDTIEVPKNAFVMIHDPMMVARGGEVEMTRAADLLSKVKAVIVETYAKRTGKTPEAISKMMSEETWMTGDVAMENGFASGVSEELPITNVAAVAASFSDYQYSRAPENLSSLWSLAMTATAKEQKQMPDTKTPEQIAAEVKAQADAQALADKAAADQRAAKDLEIKNAATVEANKRAADIMAVCNQAGKPELAADFIGNGTDLAGVQAHLLKVLCAERKPVDDGEEGTQKTDENAAYKAEYVKNSANFKAAGLSEADYIETRKIEDGKVKLAPKTAAVK